MSVQPDEVQESVEYGIRCGDSLGSEPLLYDSQEEANHRLAACQQLGHENPTPFKRTVRTEFGPWEEIK